MAIHDTELQKRTRIAKKKTFRFFREQKLMAAFIIASQCTGAYDQIQYEADHNNPENSSVMGVATDFIFQIPNWNPLFEHWSRALEPDTCSTGQIFNAAVDDLSEEGLGLFEFGARYYHLSGFVGAKAGSVAYELYDAGMSLVYDVDERKIGNCVKLKLSATPSP